MFIYFQSFSNERLTFITHIYRRKFIACYKEVKHFSVLLDLDIFFFFCLSATTSSNPVGLEKLKYQLNN